MSIKGQISSLNKRIKELGYKAKVSIQVMDNYPKLKMILINNIPYVSPIAQEHMSYELTETLNQFEKFARGEESDVSQYNIKKL